MWISLGLGAIALASSIYAAYKNSKGKKSDEIIKIIADKTPEIVDQAKVLYLQGKAIKK